MIQWSENIDEKKIISLSENPLIIDFDDLYFINSNEIRKLLMIQKNSEAMNIQLIFKTKTQSLKDLLIEFGFKDLNITIE